MHERILPNIFTYASTYLQVLRSEAFEGTGVTQELRLRTCFNFHGSRKASIEESSLSNKSSASFKNTPQLPEVRAHCQTHCQLLIEA